MNENGRTASTRGFETALGTASHPGGPRRKAGPWLAGIATFSLILGGSWLAAASGGGGTDAAAQPSNVVVAGASSGPTAASTASPATETSAETPTATTSVVKHRADPTESAPVDKKTGTSSEKKLLTPRTRAAKAAPPAQAEGETTKPGTTLPAAVADLPDSLAFTEAELRAATGVDMTKLLDLGEYWNSPTAMRQVCNSGRSTALAPANARQWMWAQENSNNLEQFSVDLVVTTWADSAQALDQLATDTGYCRFGEPLNVTESTDQSWVAASTESSSWAIPFAVAAHRTGSMIVAVTVTPPKSAGATASDELVAMATRLAETAAAKAQTTR